jgi:hypothetical protein
MNEILIEELEYTTSHADAEVLIWVMYETHPRKPCK